MAMSGSYDAVCGSAVSLAEPPTMPTRREPPFFAPAAADGEADVPVSVLLLPQAEAKGPSAARPPMAAEPLRRLRRVTRLLETSR